ncbi:MAG: GTP-binding protein [Cyanobacteria bacterium P01_G01_bin.4]
MTQQKLPLKPLLLTAGGFFVLEQAISSLTSLHSAIAPYSPWLANSLTGLLGVATTGLLGFGGYWGWQLLQGQNDKGTKKKRSRRKSTQLVKATPKLVETELGQLDELLNRLQSDVKRKTFKQRARKIGEQLASNQLRLVVYGTSSAGKTSLVNALLGHQVGDTAPTLGTTQTGSIHTYSVPGVGGRIEIADTPGLQAVGLTGETEATLLAKNADLLLFVVSGDMTATEYEQLCTLSAIGKRTLVVFNKTDRYLPDDIEEIVGSLEDKAKPLVQSSNGSRKRSRGQVRSAVPVVKVSADPMPVKVRRHQTDGTTIEVMAERVPETSELKARIKSILTREGNQLRLDNAMQQAKTLADGAAEAISKTRRKRGEVVIQRMQWATAGAIAVNPLPAVDLVAAAAINARTIGKLNKLYGRKITLKRTEQIAKSMGKLLVQIGGVEVATQVMGSALKASPLGAMGVPLQAISSAYLTRVTGLTYLDWLESEDPWDEDQMLSRLKAQLQFSGRTEFVQQFMKQALGAVKESLFSFEPAEPDQPDEDQPDKEEDSDRPSNSLSGLASASEPVDVSVVKAG